MRQKGILKFNSIKKKALPVLKQHKVKRAAIFGSVAKGTATSTSDVDFLIEYAGSHETLFDLVDLKYALEEALGEKVDVLTYRSINAKLRDRILAEQVLIL